MVYNSGDMDFSWLPERVSKPRSNRITMVMDKGLSLREAEDLMSVGAVYIDYIKLGFGTALITPGLPDKIDLYRRSGVEPYFGGTLFEIFVAKEMLDSYAEYLIESGITVVEVSDGSYDIGRREKLSIIDSLAKEFTVISEVGSKNKDVHFTLQQWVTMMTEELQAGSVKVIAEARESGTTGICNEDGSVDNELVSALSERVGAENIIWEAPDKCQQAWFINHLGPDVNLGNIAPGEIVAFEALRCGLRGDTFSLLLPG